MVDGGATAWLFSGQGAQYVGMGRQLAEQEAVAAELLQTADDVLGFSLTSLIFDGPSGALEETANQQPAILAVSIAYLTVLQQRGLVPAAEYVAGHSLGEYSALVAAGALEFSDAVRLVRRRGQLMQAQGDGGMAAILGLAPEAVATIAGEAGAEVANLNAPGQIVVSGRIEAIARAMTLAKERGAKRCVRLPVSAAFHSSLMTPVVDGMRPLVEQVPMRPARIPLVTNVGAEPVQEPEDLRNELLAQISAPVRWIDVVTWLDRAGITEYYEIGPGKVLAGLVGRIVPGRTIVTAESLLRPVAAGEGTG